MFHPFLAVLAEIFHGDPQVDRAPDLDPSKEYSPEDIGVKLKPLHPALTHKILNNHGDTSKYSAPYELPDGTKARVLFLGDEMKDGPRGKDEKGLTGWWPKALVPQVASKYRDRIRREGYAAQMCMALCTTLVAQFHSAAYEANTSNRRHRLHFHGSPISDFGLCLGSVDVHDYERLAYLLPDQTFLKGQDPDEHVWMYFKTMRGDDIVMDCGVFTFNFCMMIETGLFLDGMKSGEALKRVFKFAPVFFWDGDCEDGSKGLKSPKSHKERKRISVLRDPRVHEAFARLGHLEEANVYIPDIPKLISILDDFTGKPSNNIEKNLFQTWTYLGCVQMKQCLDQGRWRRWPAKVRIAMEVDPEEFESVEYYRKREEMEGVYVDDKAGFGKAMKGASEGVWVNSKLRR